MKLSTLPGPKPSALHALRAFAIGAGVPFATEGILPRSMRNRRAVKCALPGCENMTSHRGGYCCAEHCMEHKEKNK